MAGNIVKWWKHKILGGYKQFSVQECTTDSEELMYHQVRASSSCSAPPDLLMVSDRENNIPLRSPVVNIITTTSPTATGHHSSGAVGSSSVQKHHQQQQHAAGQQQQQQAHKEHHQHQHCSKEGSSKQHLKLSGKSAASKFVSAQQQLAVTNQQQQHQQQQDEIDGQQQTSQQRHSSHQHGKEERIRLEEFTCDVSVEGGKSTQPLQFSFTFYDLDGHHGKITKDDIVGIVYTIYESIGKSVVVPHCGSKTINVRLTVSPEGKSKSAAAAAAAAAVAGGGGGGKLKKMVNGAGTGTGVGILETATKANAGHGHGHTRRQHRYRPRKLIKSDDEDDDSNSDKEKETAATSSALAANNLGTTPAMAAVAGVGGKSKSHSSASKYNKVKSSAAATVAVAEQHQLWYQQQQEAANATEQQQQQQQTPTNLDASAAANCPHENLYENMTATNLKCCTKDALLKMEDCRGCETGVTSAPITTGYGRSPTDVYMRQASTRVKMLRKARKQKFQDHCHETRQRSLSVGSEACWHNRHSQQQQQQQQGKLEQLQLPQQQQQLGDVVDGVQLRNPHKNTAASSNVLAQRQRNSAECWKTALNRNDLMSIIRESMEKNRLCFQMSGKPQANVSPIRQPQHQHQQLHSQQPQQQQQQQQQQQHQNQQRQRSNTVSKIPTLITNHSNAIINHSSSCIMPNNSNNNNNHHSPSHNNSNSSSHSHSSNHTNNNSSEINLHDISTTNNSNNTIQYHPQPHIPIYHQQMAINPAVLAAQSGMQHGHHNKMNLCGYDSFLHATICGGGTSHSPPPGSAGPTAVATLVPQIVSLNQPTQHSSSNNANQQQLIATVQPIMTAVPSSNSTPAKVFLNSTTHQIKTSKILRSGSYSQQQAHQSITAHNSPQYHGYQRLSSSNTHHSGGHHHHYQSQQQLQQQCANKLAILNLSSVQLERSPAVDHIEKWMKNNTAKHQRKDGAAKYPDNSLYAKLSEKLQESALNTQQHNHRENMQRRKHKTAHKVRSAPLVQKLATAQQQQQLKNTYAANGIHSSSSNTSIGNYTALIPIHGDPTECENLIAPTTTDDEAVNEAPTAEVFLARKSESTVEVTNTANPVMNGAAEANKENNVTTAKLVDLSDDRELAGIEAHEQEVTIRVSDTAEANEVDEEEREEDEEEEEVETEGSGGGNASAANTSSGASSLIHRYVHEHIHHHYHHFEEKDE